MNALTLQPSVGTHDISAVEKGKSMEKGEEKIKEMKEAQIKLSLEIRKAWDMKSSSPYKLMYLKFAPIDSDE